MKPTDKIIANARAMLDGGPEAYAAAEAKLFKAWDDDNAEGKEFWRRVFDKWIVMLNRYEGDAEWLTDGTAYHLFMSASMYAAEGVDPRPSPPLTEEDACEMERYIRDNPQP